MFVFSDCDSIKARYLSEIKELEMLKAKHLSEIKMLKYKCHSEAENKPCPISEPGYVIVKGKCIYIETLKMNRANAKVGVI